MTERIPKFKYPPSLRTSCDPEEEDPSGHCVHVCDSMSSPLSPCRLRQPGLGADLSGPAPDDVLHEHEQPVADRAAAPQPAALPQEAAAPHHLHRRAAGGSGGPVPGDQVPGRRHQGAAGPQSPPPGGEGRGQYSFLRPLMNSYGSDCFTVQRRQNRPSCSHPAPQNIVRHGDPFTLLLSLLLLLILLLLVVLLFIILYYN